MAFPPCAGLVVLCRTYSALLQKVACRVYVSDRPPVPRADWTQCPFAHPSEKAKRRDPRRYKYSGTACPDFRKARMQRCLCTPAVAAADLLRLKCRLALSMCRCALA